MSTDSYKIDWLGGRAVIAMPAEIDVTNADEARQALVEAVSQGPAVLIIDMTATTFCDSAGVAAIVTAYRQASASGMQILLVAPAVERILMLTGIGELLPLHATLDAAHAAAGESQG
jgi:anti-sigma B factor antagonist